MLPDYYSTLEPVDVNRTVPIPDGSVSPEPGNCDGLDGFDESLNMEKK